MTVVRHSKMVVCPEMVVRHSELDSESKMVVCPEMVVRHSELDSESKINFARILLMSIQIF